MAAALPNIIWADETFQTVEPAHRLLTGQGLMSWEWVVGIRSWLVPGVFVPPLWLAETLHLPPGGAQAMVAGLMVTLSLIPVAVAFRWGEQTHGRAGGVIVGGLAAIWVDLVHMAPHPLTDVLASNLLVLAVYLAIGPQSRSADDRSEQPRRLLIAGALLGLSCYLRMQLGPAAAVAAGFACGRSLTRWRALLTGGVATVGALGLFDWVTLGTPLQSVWLNFYFNIIGKVSNDYSTDPAAFYLLGFVEIWGPLAIGVAGLAVFARRRWPALFWTTLAVITTQSLVAHKEWRFIFPAIPLLVILCGLQLAELQSSLRRPRWTVAAFSLAALAAASVYVGAGKVYRLFWTHEREMISAFRLIARQPGTCGVGLLFSSGRQDTPPSYSWVGSLGSTALRSGIPQYAARPEDNWRSAGSYNWLIVANGAPPPPPPFHRVRCFDNGSGQSGPNAPTACIWTRPGGCDAAVAVQPAINWPAYFIDPTGQLRTERLQPGIAGMKPPLHAFETGR